MSFEEDGQLTPHVQTIFISSCGEIRAPVSPLQHCGLRPWYLQLNRIFSAAYKTNYRFSGRLEGVAVWEGRDVAG